MRTLIIAALIAALAGAAHAQGAGGKRQSPAKSEQKTEDQAKKKADEKPIETRSIKSRNPRKSPTPGNPCASAALLE